MICPDCCNGTITDGPSEEESNQHKCPRCNGKGYLIMSAITIFLKNGSTLRFNDILDFRQDNVKGTLSFKYTSASRPGIQCVAEFYTKAMVGWSFN